MWKPVFWGKQEKYHYFFVCWIYMACVRSFDMRHGKCALCHLRTANDKNNLRMRVIWQAVLLQIHHTVGCLYEQKLPREDFRKSISAISVKLWRCSPFDLRTLFWCCPSLIYIIIVISSQQELDNALYGYTAQTWSQGTCTHALSGLKVGEITHGNCL